MIEIILFLKKLLKKEIELRSEIQKVTVEFILDEN